MKPINIAKINIVLMNEAFKKIPSYFKCIKKRRTKVALVEAINNVSQIFNPPKSTCEAMTVAPVSTKRANRIKK